MTRLITDTKSSYTIFLIIGLLSFTMRAIAADNGEVAQGNNQDIFVRPLLQFKTPHSLEFCGKPVPLDRRDVWERLDKQFLLALGREAQVILWLKRSKKYFPFIEKRLRANNLPNDLKYLAVAESDLYTYALSPKGAAGTWQFMKYTGKRFGLQNHRWMDERYSFPKATDAALTYLSDLYEQFGQWMLAVAAYNCGERRVARAIQEQKTDDFFDLHLPRETEEYLLRIMAIKIILSSPEKYGFVLDEQDYYQPYDAGQVEISSPGLIHIRLIAEAAKTNFRTIRQLNPEFRGYYLPKGKHTLFIPLDSVEGFNKRLTLSLEKANQGKKVVYRVKEGDSLSGIALKLKVSMNKLMMWNSIGENDLIYPGQRIVYYRPVWK
jgi:hypothetical protein